MIPVGTPMTNAVSSVAMTAASQRRTGQRAMVKGMGLLVPTRPPKDDSSDRIGLPLIGRIMRVARSPGRTLETPVVWMELTRIRSVFRLARPRWRRSPCCGELAPGNVEVPSTGNPFSWLRRDVGRLLHRANDLSAG